MCHIEVETHRLRRIPGEDSSSILVPQLMPKMVFLFLSYIILHVCNVSSYTTAENQEIRVMIRSVVKSADLVESTGGTL